MTPAARVAAAIEILDIIATGEAAEKTLTGWARGHRFAGSGDRAAIRDHVFDVLRCKRSFAWLGGGSAGRQLLFGWAKANSEPIEALFSGVGYGPKPLAPCELANARALKDASDAVQLDCPDWLLPDIRESLGEQTNDVLRAFQARAPLFLRVNTDKSDPSAAQAVLAEAGVETCRHSLSPTALQVTGNPRKLRQSRAYLDGLVEFQDAASQAVIDTLPLSGSKQILDYCAGGGGKALAMAAKTGGNVFAHDAYPNRMIDLPARAKRAGVDIKILAPDDLERARKFDLVVCDVPCSGSGTWRRSPHAKWELTPENLEQLLQKQIGILDQATEYVSENGFLAYLTCSILQQENERQIQSYLLRNPTMQRVSENQISPLDGGDGFFVSLLKRAI